MENPSDILEAIQSWPSYSLLRRLPFGEVEALRNELCSANSNLPSIQKAIQKKWVRFLSDFRDGAEIYEYSKSEEHWNAGLGHRGYFIQRQGKIVARLKTSWN